MLHYSETICIFEQCTQKKKYRKVIFYKDYFEKFFVIQSAKVKAKIIWTIELIEEIDRVPETYLKHIESTPGLYEIRVKFDKGKLIVLTNGFQKKTKKTPKQEIEIALRIKEEYEHENKK